MKQTIYSVLLVALAMTAPSLTSCEKAFDDVQDGNVDYFGRSKTFVEEINGQPYWFIPESDGSLNVLVTWNRINCNSIADYVRMTSKYTGDVEVPSTVTHNGVTYNVTGADDNAFYHCNNITKLVLKEGMTHWGEHTWFYSPYRNVMTKVTDIYLPTTMTDMKSVPSYYFMNNTALASCHIPNVTEIGDSAFFGCTKLTTLNLPETVSATEGIYIPASVSRIGNQAFAGCNSRAYLTVDDGNAVYTSRDDNGTECNVIMEKATKKLLLACKNSTIPADVTSYDGFAFSGVYTTKNTSLEIPAQVASIAPGAFASCTGLRYLTVAADNAVYDSRGNCNAVIETASNKLVVGCNYTVIPADVTAIGDFAFYGFSMSAMTIPEGVEAIGERAFSNCTSLKTMTLPATLKTLGDYCFYNAGKLTTLYVNAATPPVIKNSNVFSTTSKCTLYVPAGSKEAYTNHSVWGLFSSIVEMEE